MSQSNRSRRQFTTEQKVAIGRRLGCASTRSHDTGSLPTLQLNATSADAPA